MLFTIRLEKKELLHIIIYKSTYFSRNEQSLK